MSQASALEQYFLELINASRAAVGSQPLAFNGLLNDAADGHSQWMIDTDKFTHAGIDGTNSYARMLKAGYSSPNVFTWGENIAWASTRSAAWYNDEVELLHSNLMNSPGHKANLLNADFREVGLGFAVGVYTIGPSNSHTGAFITQNFARWRRADVFLTGVAFADRNGNGRYDPGEGLGDVSVIAFDYVSRITYSTVTDPAGGYSLTLPASSYQVTFFGYGTTKSQNVTIGSQNVKLDFAGRSDLPTPPTPPNPPNPPNPPPPITPKPPLVLTGTPGRDSFVLPKPDAGDAPTQIIGFDAKDFILLDNDAFTNWGSNTGVIMSSQFYAGEAAHDTTDRIMIDVATGNLIYDRDGTGPTQPVVIANVGKDKIVTYAQIKVIQ